MRGTGTWQTDYSRDVVGGARASPLADDVSAVGQFPIVCVCSCHVEYVYDHRHLLLEDASRGIVLQQQALVRKQQGLNLLRCLLMRGI